MTNIFEHFFFSIFFFLDNHLIRPHKLTKHFILFNNITSTIRKNLVAWNTFKSYTKALLTYRNPYHQMLQILFLISTVLVVPLHLR